MCNLKKTAAFEYFVSKLVGLDLEKGQGNVEELNNKLSEYPMTRYMKLLYFLCMMEAKQKRDRIAKLSTGATSKELFKDLLLNTFDNFVAYLNGPVEVDIYENRLYEGMFSLFTLEDGRLKLRGQDKDLAGRAKNILEETSPAVREATDDALSELGKKGSKIVPNKSILEQDTTSLVELSHKLNPNVWPACFYYNKQGGSISQLFQKDSTLLDAEVQEFEEKLTQIEK